MSKMPSCPRCGSEKVIKNGSIHNRKPKFSCKECRRQFIENPLNKIIPQDTWNLVEKILIEKISVAGIARVAGISEVLIQKYINRKYNSAPKRTKAVFKKSHLILERDEIWSFFGSKKNKLWMNHAGKMLCFILTSGCHVKKFFHLDDISLSERRAEKQVILKGST